MSGPAGVIDTVSALLTVTVSVFDVLLPSESVAVLQYSVVDVSAPVPYVEVVASSVPEHDEPEYHL